MQIAITKLSSIEATANLCVMIEWRQIFENEALGKSFIYLTKTSVDILISLRITKLWHALYYEYDFEDKYHNIMITRFYFQC